MIGTLQRQLDAQAHVTDTPPVPAEQFLVTLVGSCLFPFASRSMLTEVLGLGPRALKRFMDQRRRDLPAFLKRGLEL